MISLVSFSMTSCVLWIFGVFCNFSSELNHWFTLANWLIYPCSCCLNGLSCIDIRLMLHACQLVLRLGLHWADWFLSFPSLALATVLMGTGYWMFGGFPCHILWIPELPFHDCFIRVSCEHHFFSVLYITWCLDGWALTWYGAWSSDSIQLVAGTCVSSQKVCWPGS